MRSRRRSGARVNLGGAVFRDPIREIIREPVRAPIVRTVPRFVVAGLEDRRQFHPAGLLRPLASLTREARTFVVPPDRRKRFNSLSMLKSPVRRLIEAGSPVFGFPSNRVAFRIPSEVSVCVKRRIRKEVMHARGKAGGSVRPPRRNRYSDVEC